MLGGGLAADHYSVMQTFKFGLKVGSLVWTCPLHLERIGSLPLIKKRAFSGHWYVFKAVFPHLSGAVWV